MFNVGLSRFHLIRASSAVNRQLTPAFIPFLVDPHALTSLHISSDLQASTILPERGCTLQCPEIACNTSGYFRIEQRRFTTAVDSDMIVKQSISPTPCPGPLPCPPTPFVSRRYHSDRPESRRSVFLNHVALLFGGRYWHISPCVRIVVGAWL